MNFLSISQAVYRRVKLSDTPSTADTTRIQQFINLWYREILAMPGMDRFRDTVLTFATVNTQKQYGLPQALTRVRSLYDVTNQRRIQPQTVDWLRNVDPGLTATSSTVNYWIPLNGYGAVQQTLTTTGVGLWVVSDTAGDTTQKAYLETTRLSGVRAGTAVAAGTTLNGITRVQVGTRTDHIEVVKFYLDVVPAGTISLYDAAAAGNLLAQITPGRTQARYFMLQLYPTPSAVITVSVDCQRSIEDLTNNTEEPLFPEDFHHVLVHGASYEEWLNRNDDRKKEEYTRLTKVLADLRHTTQTTPDEIPVQRGPRGMSSGASRLGGWFPRDTTG